MAAEDLSYTCWLDPIIEEQARHYGLPREKFVTLMGSAAVAQELIETGHLEEPCTIT